MQEYYSLFSLWFAPALNFLLGILLIIGSILNIVQCIRLFPAQPFMPINKPGLPKRNPGFLSLSGREDSNLRPHGPEPCALSQTALRPVNHETHSITRKLSRQTFTNVFASLPVIHSEREQPGPSITLVPSDLRITLILAGMRSLMPET